MAITYDWTFNPFIVKPAEGSLVDVVVAVEWRRTAIDGIYSSSIYGQIPLGPPNPGDYTEFSSLTKAQAQEWVVSSLTQSVIDRYDESLAADIEQQKNPPTILLPPPWSDSTV